MHIDYRDLIKKAPVALARVRQSDGQIIMANDKMAVLFGYGAPEDLIAQFSFTDPACVSGSWSETIAGLSNEPDQPRDLMVRSRDGVLQQIEIHGAPDGSAEYIDISANITVRSLQKEALDAISASISIYDSQDKRVYANKEFTRLNTTESGEPRQGETFESLMRNLVLDGKVSEADGREEEWIRERVERHKSPQGVFIIDRGPQGWVQVDEQKLSNGSSVVLSFDITPTKRNEIITSESAERLKRILDVSPIATLIVNRDGRYVYVNERAASGFGLSRTQMLGRMSQDFYKNTSDRKAILTQLNQHGSAVDIEAELKRADGTTFWALISVYVDPDNPEQKIAWYYDIDERQIAHRKLVELSEAIEVMPEPIAIFDSDDRYAFTNKAMRESAKLFGSQIKLGMKFENHLWNVVGCGAIPSAKGAETEWVLKRMERHRGPRHSFELERTDGKYYQAIDIALKGGGRMILHADVSKIKYAQLELRDARDQAEIANRAKSEFLAIVSHELRTPLTSIKGSLGLLIGTMAENFTDDMRLLIDMASRNSDALLILINDILDFEKIMSGNMVIEKYPFELSQVTGDLIDTLGGYLESQAISITYQIPNTPFWALIDKTRYEQVLRNLISNAAKFSPGGSAVKITLRRSKKHVRISVVDKGVGIPASEQERIFDHFTQVDSSDVRSQSGTGLGLPISKALVESMGGRIGCKSKLGSGSTFYIDLPMADPA